MYTYLYLCIRISIRYMSIHNIKHKCLPILNFIPYKNLEKKQMTASFRTHRIFKYVCCCFLLTLQHSKWPRGSRLWTLLLHYLLLLAFEPGNLSDPLRLWSPTLIYFVTLFNPTVVLKISFSRSPKRRFL